MGGKLSAKSSPPIVVALSSQTDVVLVVLVVVVDLYSETGIVLCRPLLESSSVFGLCGLTWENLTCQ